MKITWIGHSCFKIEKDGYSIIIDPYTKGSVPGLDPVAMSADQVLCSHEHGDHNGRGEVLLTEKGEKNPFSVEVIQTFHDDVQGAKRGKNQIFIISDGKQKIAHFGDLGCALTSAQSEKIKNLDAALIPVGGYYTIDGNQAADLVHALNPRIVIPMHYRDDAAGFGYNEIGTVETFTEHMDDKMNLTGSEIDTAKIFDCSVIVIHPLRKKNKS